MPPKDEIETFLRKLDRELKSGLLSVLVLAALRKKDDQYGYQIIERLHEVTNGSLIVPEGTIYPILHSLHAYGFVRTKWGLSENGPPRKYYRLTAEGKKALEEGLRLWNTVVESSEAITRKKGGE